MSEVRRIIDRNLESFTQPSFRRAFKDLTAGELQMLFDIPRDIAFHLVDDYLRFLRLSLPPELRLSVEPEPEIMTAVDWYQNKDLEVSLDEEYGRQSRQMAKLFAGTLGLSEEEYIKTLPCFPEKPSVLDKCRLRPLIVEGKEIHWRDQARLSNITVKIPLRDGDIENWDSIPEKPHAVWVSIAAAVIFGSGFRFGWDIVQGRVRKLFALGDKFGNVVEGIAYSNAYPDIGQGGLIRLCASSTTEKMVCLQQPNPGLPSSLEVYNARDHDPASLVLVSNSRN